MGKQLIKGLLSLMALISFFACDHHGREVVKQLDCDETGCDSVVMHFIPSKINYSLSKQLITIKADSLGMFFVTKAGCNACKGSSKVVIQAADGGPALNVNFFYSEKKNDSDTLSTLGLLPFKGKLTYVKEVFYDEKRKPDTLGLIQF
jgi:hypothetical protein